MIGGAFKEDTGLQRKYSVEVKNRFNVLCEDNDDRDMEKESLDEGCGVKEVRKPHHSNSRDQ